MARYRSPLHRAVIFAGIALAFPLVACKWLSKGEETDAAPPTAEPAATAAPSATNAQTAPATSTEAPASGGAGGGAPSNGRRVVVKLPDGGSVTIDASLGPDGAIVMPPGFQLPTFPGFDAAAFKLPAFDAASLPPFPSSLPKIPGFGIADGGK